jgi:hypothetical protein
VQSAVAVDEVSQTFSLVHAGQGDGEVLGVASYLELHHSLAVGAAVGEERLNIVHPLKLCHPHWLQTTDVLQIWDENFDVQRKNKGITSVFLWDM